MAKPTRLAAGSEPLHIFQDAFSDQMTPSISRAPMPSVQRPLSPRRALATTDANAILHPPNGLPKQPGSPFKGNGSKSSPLAPLRQSQNNKLNSVSIFPPSEGSQGSTDSLPKKQPLMSRFKTVAQKPSMESAMSFGKENVHPTIYPAPPSFNVNLENYYPKPPGKRGLLEAAPIKDSRPIKKAKVEDGSSFMDSIPMVADDGSKPNHSYAQLIGMAILRAPQRRLTLSQIYKWISDSYSFYRADDAGWQNSIRHNLSLNKAFIKQERPKDDPGKGNYWAIEPGMEAQFTREKSSKKAASGAENVPVMSVSTRLEPAQSSDPTLYQGGLPSLPPALPIQPQFPHNGVALQAAPLPAPEVSSDATIPMSDNIGPEDQNGKQLEQDLPTEGPYSPLPIMMHSSPPIPRHMEPRSNTPPPASRGSRSSQARKHKRKHASMDASLDDSGYISSLDSSVMRSNQAGRLLTSEADRPRSKRSRAGGRAEEEIARLRASSYDSPSRGRSHGCVPPSSSPIRQQNDGLMLPPLTPAVKLKPPPKPPASVSPNTNLRLHRDKVNHMLNSPLRRVSNMSEAMPWSPAFRLDDSLFHVNDFISESIDFDIFEDNSLDTFFSAVDSAGSPVKRSAKRPRVERPASADALGEITKSCSNKGMNSVPFLKAPVTPFALDFETPSKAFEGLSSPIKAFLQSPTATKTAPPAKGQWTGLEDICTQLFEDDPDDSAVDILQGFEKIGSSQAVTAPPPKPAFGRSYTTTF